MSVNALEKLMFSIGLMDQVSAPLRKIDKAIGGLKRSAREGFGQITGGAVGLAALLAEPARFAGRRVGLVVTGGNVDTRLLSSLLLRDLARSRRLARLRIELVDVPGQLSAVSDVIAKAGGNVTDVAYHKTFSDLPAKVTYIDISLEAQDAAHMDRIEAAFRTAGFRAEPAGY